jgi:murein DD-endopeptidase MepM/ murein hydrolase activator NlpD
MLFLEIEKNSIKRGEKNLLFQFIPNQNREFWEDFYSQIAATKLQDPIEDSLEKIDPLFGYFGLRYHPLIQQANYFHTGIDIVDDKSTPIYPVADGIFEYSGYHKINGNYIMLSHPQISTMDGFIMHSLYLHLDDYNIRFKTHQKLLRRLGLKKLTNKFVSHEDPIGALGDSGISKEIFTHLHLQIEFRNQEKKVIIIDPVPCFGGISKENLTKDIKDVKSLKALLKKTKTKNNYNYE